MASTVFTTRPKRLVAAAMTVILILITGVFVLEPIRSPELQWFGPSPRTFNTVAQQTHTVDTITAHSRMIGAESTAG